MGRPVPPPDEVRVIAIRLTNWVGDCVMNTPFLARVRDRFPHARVVVLGRRNVAGLFRHHPHVDELWEIDDRTRRGFTQAAGRLRGLAADLGFALPNSLKAAGLLALGRVRHRVGYDRDGRRWLLTHPIRLRPEDLAVHEVRYYLRLLHPWEREAREPEPLLLRVGGDERTAFDDWLESRAIDRARPLIGVNPAAFYGTAKRWLPERYAEAARILAEERDATVVVTGLPAERDVAGAVCAAGGERFHNAAGEMSLRELMAFLDRCALYLTNDSGAMHIAAALRRPTVAIFGSTDWVTTAPLGAHTRIVRVETPCAPCLLRDCPIDHRCMTGVTVPMVVEAARNLLPQPAQGALTD